MRVRRVRLERQTSSLRLRLASSRILLLLVEVALGKRQLLLPLHLVVVLVVGHHSVQLLLLVALGHHRQDLVSPLLLQVHLEGEGLHLVQIQQQQGLDLDNLVLRIRLVELLRPVHLVEVPQQALGVQHHHRHLEEVANPLHLDSRHQLLSEEALQQALAHRANLRRLVLLRLGQALLEVEVRLEGHQLVVHLDSQEVCSSKIEGPGQLLGEKLRKLIKVARELEVLSILIQFLVCQSMSARAWKN